MVWKESLIFVIGCIVQHLDIDGLLGSPKDGIHLYPYIPEGLRKMKTHQLAFQNVCLHRWHIVITYQGNTSCVSFYFLSKKTFVCLSLINQIWLTSPGTIPENLPCEVTNVPDPSKFYWTG